MPRGPVHRWPALDGIRGLAVAAVLVYHQEFEWARGGFLGVSTFFTLSGFLIATLLLNEHATRGSIALRRFWARRARRLLPASALALAGILVYIAVLVPETQRIGSVGDVRAALGFVLNWRFIATQGTYAAVVADPSPVQHYWSLAIEEQFYLLFPLLVSLCLRRARGVLTGVLVALAGASLVIQLLAHDDRVRSYYGTDTRALELLVGALLAIWFARTMDRSDEPRGRRPEVIGWVGLGATLTLWAFARQQDAWLYSGGLAGVALASAALIYGATRGQLLPRLLSTRPLPWLGRISYGVYLFHWPIFLWLTPDRTGLDGWALFGVRAAVTLAAADVSFGLVEWPFRRGGVLPGATALVGAAAAACFLVGVSVPVSTPRTYRLADLHGDALRVFVIGDSTAEVWGRALDTVGSESGHVAVLHAPQAPGCGLIDGRVRFRDGWEQSDNCAAKFSAAVNEGVSFRPDVVLLSVGYPDLADWQLPGEQQWRHLGDRVFDDAYRSAARSALWRLVSLGAPVLWPDVSDPQWVPEKTNPDAVIPGHGDPTINDADRSRRLNELNREIAASFPSVRIARFEQQLARKEAGRVPYDPNVRFDGLHLSPDASVDLVRSWLGDELYRASVELKTAA
jgi:peptidoglycan/LPS O-acetylase OafA/YrhL